MPNRKSSEVMRSGWLKSLLAVPKEQRSITQQSILFLIPKLDHAFDVMLWDDAVNDGADLVPDTLRALLTFVEVVYAAGSAKSLRTYGLSQKNMNLLGKLLTDQFNIIDDISDLEIDFEPEIFCDQPEIMVDLLIAAVLKSGMYLYSFDDAAVVKSGMTLYSFDDAETAAEAYVRKKSMNKGFQKLLSAYSPAKEKMCNFILKELEPDASSITIRDVVRMLKQNVQSLRSELCYNSCQQSSGGSIDEFTSILTYLKTQVEKFLSKSETEPGYVCFYSFSSLEYQFKRMAWCYQLLISTGQVPLDVSTHPVHVAWWETAGLYLKLLKKEIVHANKAIPADPFSVANLNRQLLVALGAGCEKTVSYTEIKQFCDDMEPAVDACIAWAPQMWKLEKATDIKIIKEDVLPFLQSKRPSDYETASFDVFTTDGFLELYTAERIFQRLYVENGHECGKCGMTAPDLLKCQGCKKSWYCDAECQTKHWKKHKKECKELQQAKKEASS